MPYRVAIIGAGFGGIGMAIALERAGIEDFVVRPVLPGIPGQDEFAGRRPGPGQA